MSSDTRQTDRTRRRTESASGAQLEAWTSRQPHLLASEPLLRLVLQLDRAARDRELYTPGDPAVTTLSRAVQLLQASIEEAAEFEAMIDVKTAAQVLNLSVSMVTRLCRTGELNALKVGGEWRVFTASVKAMLGRRN